MDATIYGNVVDIQLHSMAYLTVIILYLCLIMYKDSNHAVN